MILGEWKTVGPSVREGAQKMTRCISSLLIIIKIKGYRYACGMLQCSVGAKQRSLINSSDE
jgi:hypothetical protein